MRPINIYLNNIKKIIRFVTHICNLWINWSIFKDIEWLFALKWSTIAWIIKFVPKTTKIKYIGFISEEFLNLLINSHTDNIK